MEKVGSARSSNKAKRVEPDLAAVSADPRSMSSSYRSPRDDAAFSSSGREQSLGDGGGVAMRGGRALVAAVVV